MEGEGISGLLEKARNKPRIGNRVEPEIEERILKYSLENPMHGQSRTANELKKEGIIVSPGGIRSIWLRHGLERRALRFKRLERWAGEEGHVLTESQVQALEKAKEEKEAHGEIETYHPGFLLGQDTFYVGWIKGVGKIYQQTGIDTYSNIGFAKLWRSVKCEDVYLKAYDSVEEARQELKKYFEFYNHKRRHQRLDRRTPNVVYCSTLPQKWVAA